MQCVMRAQVAEPMDLETLLARVDARRYSTAAAYLADARLVAVAAAQFWAGDPAAVREVRRQQHSLVYLHTFICEHFVFTQAAAAAE